MPKSKRNKQISLTKKKKNSLELKKHLIQEVQSSVDKYSNIFVFSVNDMRNSKLKEVREKWKHSRFFFGKNKVMAIALGRGIEEEYRPNLHKISKQLKGQCGLLFSNQSKDEIISWFNSYSESDYARSGNVAPYAVNLPEGPLPQFPHSLEPYLRQLGLPTTLKKGVICLIKEHQVCKEGDVLTPESAKILKLLGYEMAEFRISLVCVWSSDGSFMKLSSGESSDKENVQMQVDAPIDNKSLDKEASEEEDDDDQDDEEEEPEDKLHSETVASSKTDSSEARLCEIDKLNLNKSENEAEVESMESAEQNINEEEKSTEVEDTSSKKRDDKPKRKSPLTAEKMLSKKMCMDVSSPEDKSPLIRNLRNRTVKIERKKKK